VGGGSWLGWAALGGECRDPGELGRRVSVEVGAAWAECRDPGPWAAGQVGGLGRRVP